MNSRERMRAAILGEPVDRAPIWLREGFPIVTGPAAADDFSRGWQADPIYRELFEYVRPHVDEFAGWSVFGQNRFLMIPPTAISGELVVDEPDRKQTKVTLKTPRRELVGYRESRRGEATSWWAKHPVETEDDLRLLAEVPFEVSDESIRKSKESYRKALAGYGRDYLLQSGVSSPIVCISGVMKFELFLELSLTQSALFHELCQEITRRILAILERVFDEPMDTVMNFGGSEQCTPPMMAPQAYQEYVVPYDGQIVEFFKQHGVLVKFHCHGKVRQALQDMVAMGVDTTDPVEPPPAGDVTYAEAREIAGDRLTLMGNLEWDRLEAAEPEEIRAHVKEILGHGNRRLILGASAGPISWISRRLADNYRTWVDTALECA